MKIFRNSLFIISLIIMACGGAARNDGGQIAETEPDSYASYRAYDYFVKGDLYEQSGSLTEAAEMYRKALIYDPSSLEIRRTLSSVYLKLGRFNEAAVLRSEIKDKSAEDYNFIGNCLQYTKDFSGAADFYKRSLELDSTQYMPRRYLAVLLQTLGNYNEAEKHYRAAVHYSPDKKGSLLDLGAFYMKAKKYDKAIDAFSEAQNEKDTDIRVLANLAGAMMAKGDTSRADSLYQKTMKDNWDDPVILQALLPLFFSINNIEYAEKVAGRIAEHYTDDPDILRRYAFILFGNQKFAEAESLLIRIDEKGFADSDVYYYLGRLKQFDEEYDLSEDYFRKALALEDSLSDAWINMALSVDRLGRYEESLGIMKSALEKVPADNIEILFYTSLIHSRNEKHDLARDGYSRLLESNPDNIQFRFNLAAACERLGDFDMAEKHFKKILEVDPDNALTLNYLGYMYADKGINLDEAIRMIEKALTIEPDNGAFLDSYAWVLYKLGRYEEAIIPMKSAIESEQDDAILYDHQGDIYAALNQIDKAVESWGNALKLDPDNDEIRAKINNR
ncbi:MAG: tetratricopeptide repeat protein [Candidatus Zixiibacteriota bacterium]|nr:MAG: tetratricopeptide repeat protein [candidate division Zixibacteria bacterium]